MQQPLQPNGHENHGPKSKRHSKSAPKADPHSEKTRVSAGNPPLEGDKPTVVWENPEVVKTQVVNEGYQHEVKGARKGEQVQHIEELPPEDVVTYVTQAVNEDIQRNLTRSAYVPSTETPEIEVREEDSEATSDQLSNQYKSKSSAHLTESGEVEVDVSEFDVSPESDSENPVTVEISLEEFLAKENLENEDPYLLYEFLKDDLENPAIWAFIEKVAPKPADVILLRRNLNFLSPQFIQALLVAGSFRQNFIDPNGHRNSIFLVMGAELNKGGLGQVSTTLYAFEDDLELKSGLAKTALEAIDAQAVFQDELIVAREIKHLLDNNQDDPRAKHVLYPIHVGDNFIVMPQINNAKGKVNALNSLINKPNSDVREWARIMQGAVEGNTFLAENGFINNDFKPGNVLEGKEGGVLIDWGGFFNKKKMLAEGKIEVLGNLEQASMYPIVQNSILSLMTEEKWEKNKGNIPNTSKYFSVHLMSMELMGQMPVGATHKFQLYRNIEIYFLERYPQLKTDVLFHKLGEMDKLYADPIELGDLKLNEGEQLLYELYLKLHQAHFHPYRFKEDNVKNGIDPKFISNGEIIARLEEIANLSKL